MRPLDADSHTPARAQEVFPGTSEMAMLMRCHDWAATPVGPVEHWPQSLRTAVSICITSRFPIELWWGPSYARFYNDAYRPILGANKHPQFLGRPGRECWGEVWDVIGPMLDGVRASGEATWSQDMPLLLNRNGYPEETYFTFSYSPVFGEGGAVDGVFCACTETTARVLGERRLAILAELGERAVTSTSAEQACHSMIEVLSRSRREIPFALLYRREGASDDVTLVAATGLSESSPARPAVARLSSQDGHPWAFAAARASRSVQVERDLAARFGPLQAGGLPEPISTALVFPLTRGGPAQPDTFLVTGVNPRRPLDDGSLSFLRLVANYFSSALGNADARGKLEGERERLHRFLLDAPAAISITRGPTHAFEFSNLELRRVVGGRELLGRPLAEAVPESTSNGMLEIFDQVYRSGEAWSGQAKEVRLPGADGVPQERYFDWSVSPSRDAAGDVEGIVSFASEVTAQVVARNLAEEARQGLQVAGRAKDEFLAMLGHELRNPLSPILTALQLMRLRGDETASRERAVIERQVGHLVGLVDDLLDVSRITRGKIELRRRAVDISEVLAAGIEIASPLLESKHHALTLDAPRGTLVVDGDPGRLAQVVSNLVANAAKYTDPGGHIGVTVRREQDAIVLSVRDDGMGMPAELLPRIFDVFEQGARAFDRAQGGLGLGLAIVRSIVSLHGGTVSATSAGPGRGSTFVGRLPASNESATSTMPPPPLHPSPPRAAPTRVLVVDDNEDAAELLQYALQAQGFEVHVAHDGPSALALAERAPPDLAILDLGLPVMDGYELARRLRSLRRGPRLGLFALTGYGQETDRQRSAAAGFDEHLVKPLDLSVLEAKMKGFLGGVKGRG